MTDYDDVRAELRAEIQRERRMAAYLAHPDPRDPDYPHEYEREDDDDGD
jgi:hypothetical protein